MLEIKEKNFTYSDYLKNKEEKYFEVLNGISFIAPAPNPYHQDVSRNLFSILERYIQKNKCGKLYYAPVDVILSDTVILQPDLFYIQNENLSIIKNNGIFGVPDLVIEIVSPSSLVKDTEYKKKIYQEFKVKEYWTVFYLEKVVVVYSLLNDNYEVFSFAETEGKIKSKLLPNLEFDIKEIF